jgi:hypothetical protein
MLYKTIVSLALFGAAFAAPVAKRDLQTIQSGVTSISSALTQLDTAIKAVNGPADTANLLGASQAVNTALTSATTQIMATQPITLTDALSLQQSAQGLTTAATNAVNDIIAKKAIIQQAGAQQSTLQGLQQQKTASTALAQAITSKVPANVQNIATQQTAQIGQALDKAIAAFT